VRALVVSNMKPDPAHPERGSFVRDQVAALRALDGLEVELFEFPPGPRALARATLRGRATAGRRRYDVVHAHFGLSAWPSLWWRARVRALTVHGTDLLHPRSRLATAAALPLVDVIAAVSDALVAQLPCASARRRAQVLPCGVDTQRFQPLPREQARATLGLAPDRAYVLFPADPARAEKRYDRAQALCATVSAELLTLGGIVPERVSLWINAADAVVVPSEREGFGLAVLEALACERPVLATPVGIHAQALDGLAGSLCAPFDLARWRAALEPHLAASASARGTRSDASRPATGAARARAERFSARRMAERVADAWRAALER
jgi:glycosyltransferase involved in cell wall biosynthesis